MQRKFNRAFRYRHSSAIRKYGDERYHLCMGSGDQYVERLLNVVHRVEALEFLVLIIYYVYKVWKVIKRNEAYVNYISSLPFQPNYSFAFANRLIANLQVELNQNWKLTYTKIFLSL